MNDTQEHLRCLESSGMFERGAPHVDSAARPRGKARKSLETLSPGSAPLLAILLLIGVPAAGQSPLTLPDGERCKECYFDVASFTFGAFRVVFPAGAAIARADAEALVAEIQSQSTLPGLVRPGELVGLTVVLAPAIGPGLEGRAYGPGARIAIPIGAAFDWGTYKLRRILRHEVAHVALSQAIGHAQVPMWFDEGYAAWASGELGCDGEMRVVAEVEIARQLGSLNRLAFVDAGRSRADSYALWWTVLAFLDADSGSAVSSGKLFRDIRTEGFLRALAAATKKSVSEFEAAWREHLAAKFSPRNDPCACAGHAGDCAP